MSLVMYDDITLSALPAGAPAYAGYVNGHYENWSALKAAHGSAHLLDISVFAGGNATCLDVETGDATIGQIFGWFKAQRARGVYRPVIYTSASNLAALYATMKANGFARGTYRVWSAHYTKTSHICSSASCGFSVGGSAADATQFTDVALGRSLDESLLAANFFATAPKPTPTPPPPVHSGPPFRHEADGTRSLNAVAGALKESPLQLVAYNVTAPLDEKNRKAFDAYVTRDPLSVKMPAGLVYYTSK